MVGCDVEYGRLGDLREGMKTGRRNGALAPMQGRWHLSAASVGTHGNVGFGEAERSRIP